MKDSFLSDEEKAAKLSAELIRWRAGIVNGTMLWDMRCWDKYKDHDEILRMIDQIEESKKQGKGVSWHGIFGLLNEGHAVYCVGSLLKNGISKEEICGLFMQNNHRPYYAKRIVKCWGGVCGPSPCPHYSEPGGFSKCPCDACDGKV